MGKKPKLTTFHTRKRNEIDLKNLNLYSGIVIEIIKNGGVLKDLINEISIPIKQINRLVANLGLTDKRMQNSLILHRERAIKNWKEYGSKQKGVELKPITEMHRNDYIKMKNSGKCIADIKKFFKKKYDFRHKKVYQLITLFGKPERADQSGKNNPMYGRSPSCKAGIGISGSIVTNGEKIIFRSSLELRVFVWLIRNNIYFKLSKHRIKYIDENEIHRTYNPDIVIDKKIYEIKPKKLINLKRNQLKFQALKNYCKKFNLSWGIIQEDTYNINTQENIDDIFFRIKSEEIYLTEKNYKRLLKVLENEGKNKRS